MIVKQSIGIKASLGLIKKSENPLAPVIEGVINSLDAIKQRQDIGVDFLPTITISLFFRTEELFPDSPKAISSVSIEDNGIGFIPENLVRLKSLGEKSKGLNNRGTGKIQIFYRFEKMNIISIIKDNGEYKKLKVSYDVNDHFSEDVEIIRSDDSQIKTIVRMDNFSGDDKEKEFFYNFLITKNALKKEIIKQLFLRLFLEKDKGLTVHLKVFEDSTLKLEDTISRENIPNPEKIENVSIVTVHLANPDGPIRWEPIDCSNTLTLHRFKMPMDDIDGNEVYLCSKNIPVERYPFPLLRKNANFDGTRYLTSISGTILDDEENVKHSVDGFTFPHRKAIEDSIKAGDWVDSGKDFIFLEEIKKKLDNKLSELYSDLQHLKDEKEQEVLKIAQSYGISSETISETRIGLNDSDEEITQKLFQTQAKHFAQKNIEIQHTYEELVALETVDFDPTDPVYEERFNETSRKLLELIPEQNKDELARYIIRRDMVVRLLRLALRRELSKQQEWARQKEKGETVREEHEAIIHDLIFRRKTKGIPNDLWILNEEFVHFSCCSDLPLQELEIDGVKLLKSNIDIENALNQVGLNIERRLEKRPDIFIYPEEGKCILIEFKAPQVDISLHLDQIAKYAKLIANYSEKRIIQFYGYLIGENINRIDLSDRYKAASHNEYWFYPSEQILSIETQLPIADIYQEIIPLSTIAQRAEIRNRSFADKLGILEILEQSSLKSEVVSETKITELDLSKISL